MEIMKYGSIETIQSSIAKHLSPVSVAFKAAYLPLSTYIYLACDALMPNVFL